MQISLVFYLIWSLQMELEEALDNDVYQEFTEVLCKEQCTTLRCPPSTFIIIKNIHIVPGYKKYKKCYEFKNKSLFSKVDTLSNHCFGNVKIELLEKINLICANKSKCSTCQWRVFAEGYGNCTETIASSIDYICIPDIINEEMIPANTYIDLSCANLIQHRIVIQKAMLIPFNENILKKGFSRKAECTALDVSSHVSKECSKKYKCQAGPNSLFPKDCSSSKLQIMYSCVPESILKIYTNPRIRTLVLKTVVPNKPKKKYFGQDVQNIEERKYKKSSSGNEEFDTIWIASVSSVLIVALLSVFIIIYWCRSKKQLKHNSLSSKIKLVNFSPPPSSIDKIEIDIRLHDEILPESSNRFYSSYHNSFPCDSEHFHYWNDTLSGYPIENTKTDFISSSFSAGSSGKMSACQSESPKGIRNIKFNFIKNEPC